MMNVKKIKGYQKRIANYMDTMEMLFPPSHKEVVASMIDEIVREIDEVQDSEIVEYIYKYATDFKSLIRTLGLNVNGDEKDKVYRKYSDLNKSIEALRLEQRGREVSRSFYTKQSSEENNEEEDELEGFEEVDLTQ